MPSEDVGELGEPVAYSGGDYPAPGEQLERDESRLAVAEAFARLPQRCQTLLRLLVTDPPVSYEEISALLDIPVGSIGPTRARCLGSLRSSPEVFRIIGGLPSS